MKALKKISYDEEVDILMIQLSNKKIDDSYETDFGVVEIAEDKEPVLIEIFSASKFFKNLSKMHKTKKGQRPKWVDNLSSVSIPHKIK